MRPNLTAALTLIAALGLGVFLAQPASAGPGGARGPDAEIVISGASDGIVQVHDRRHSKHWKKFDRRHLKHRKFDRRHFKHHRFDRDRHGFRGHFRHRDFGHKPHFRAHRACYPTRWVEHWRHGRKVLIGGVKCRDRFGRSFLLHGSRHVVRFIW